MVTLKALMSVMGYTPMFDKILKVYTQKTIDTAFKCMIRVIWLYDAINQLEVIFDLIDQWDSISNEALSTIRSSTLSKSVKEIIELTKQILAKIKYLYTNNKSFKSLFIFRGKDYHEFMWDDLK